MRTLTEDELGVVAGGSDADLSDARGQAEDTCGDGQVKSVTVETTTKPDGTTTVKKSFTCED